MSQFYEYNWPAPVENGISLSQETTLDTPLLLNGSYVNKTTGTVNFINFGIIPRITIYSNEDFSGVNFLITGYQNGIFISETLTGPNANTVTSVNCFDTVEQIIPDTTVNENVQVGVASVGYFPIILLNTANCCCNMLRKRSRLSFSRVYCRISVPMSTALHKIIALPTNPAAICTWCARICWA